MFTRKDAPGKCPSCHKGGYDVDAARDGRPLFSCVCGKRWSCGQGGGEYLSESGRGKFHAEFGAISFAPVPPMV